MAEKKNTNEEISHMLNLMETLQAFADDAKREYRRLRGLTPWESVSISEFRREPEEGIKSIYADLDLYTDLILEECDTPKMNGLVAHVWDDIQDMCHIALDALSDKGRE